MSRRSEIHGCFVCWKCGRHSRTKLRRPESMEPRRFPILAPWALPGARLNSRLSAGKKQRSTVAQQAFAKPCNPIPAARCPDRHRRSRSHNGSTPRCKSRLPSFLPWHSISATLRADPRYPHGSKGDMHYSRHSLKHLFWRAPQSFSTVRGSFFGCPSGSERRCCELQNCCERIEFLDEAGVRVGVCSLQGVGRLCISESGGA